MVVTETLLIHSCAASSIQFVLMTFIENKSNGKYCLFYYIPLVFFSTSWLLIGFAFFLMNCDKSNSLSSIVDILVSFTIICTLLGIISTIINLLGTISSFIE